MIIKQHPDSDNIVAIETGPNVTAGKWFYYDNINGGHYTDGKAEGIADWPAIGE